MKLFHLYLEGGPAQPMTSSICVFHLGISLGADGVTGSKAVRALVKGQGKVTDAALNELIANGLVDRFKAGRAWVYYATDAGIQTLEEGGETLD